MKKYRIGFNFSGYANYEVEAKNEEEAYNKAKKLMEKDAEKNKLQIDDLIHDNDCDIVEEE